MPTPQVIDQVADRYFSICENRSVLEVGPFTGYYTKEILKRNPRELTLLEANSEAVNALLSDSDINKNSRIIHGDVHRDLVTVGKVDVVILLGVIYHSHAPLAVFEHIINYCDPELILIDYPGSQPGWHAQVTQEQPGIPGNRYITDRSKTCNLVIGLGQDVVLQALDSLGYHPLMRETYLNAESSDHPLCIDIPIFLFKKS